MSHIFLTIKRSPGLAALRASAAAQPSPAALACNSVQIVDKPYAYKIVTAAAVSYTLTIISGSRGLTPLRASAAEQASPAALARNSVRPIDDN